MNAICRVLSVTACLTLFATCGSSTSKGKEGINEEVTESRSEKKNSDGDNLIVFTINQTETVSSTGQNIGRFSLGGKKCINITSNMHKDTRTINMNIAGTTVGTYQLGTGLSGSYGTSSRLYARCSQQLQVYKRRGNHCRSGHDKKHFERHLRWQTAQRKK
jgi:hypothetical protein